MQTDAVYTFNKHRWEALAQANATFSRPWLNETPESALRLLNASDRLGSLHDKDVLCLAGGGGQQSVAFALNKARVTVLDISDGQLNQDQLAAKHYGYTVSTFQGDMRDLSIFESKAFDIVSQPYALNFVPDCRKVFEQVARIVRPDGLYLFWAANPFAAGLGSHSWNGQAFEVKAKYQQGEELNYQDEAWVFSNDTGKSRPEGPREYRQLLSTIINGIISSNFTLLHMQEETGGSQSDQDPLPGSWDHFLTIMPPWLSFLAKRNVDDYV